MMKPEEHCDLQPTTDCQIVTSLIPHLRQREVCESVPKEFCHTKLDSPKMVRKPVTMKWCTFLNGNPNAGPPTTVPTKPSPALNHTTLLPLYYHHQRPQPTTPTTPRPRPTTPPAPIPQTTETPYYYYRPEPTTARPTTPEPTTPSAPETTTRPYYYYRPEPTTPRPTPEPTTPPAPEPTTMPYYYYQPTPSEPTTPKPTPPPTTPPPTTPESYYPYYQPEQPKPTPQQNNKIPSIFNGFLRKDQ